MRKRNPPEKGVIVFAIPSYKEADTIVALTQTIDKGLSEHFGEYRSVIVNADNDSPDGTKEAFLKAPTKNEKVYLTSRGKPKRVRGKGFHMRMVYEYALRHGAAAIGFIDGDVTSATPDWVRRLIGPILEEEYDHVLPVYLRHEYDGSITNHLVFPALYGLLYADIRQPLGGEIGVSTRAAETFLSRKWYDTANHYGVDIFMVTESIFHNLRIAQTFLGVKSHKPSAPKLDPMFLEVADSLFRQLRQYRSLWRKQKTLYRVVPLLERPTESFHSPELPFDYKSFKEDILREYRKNEKAILGLCRPFSGKLAEGFTENGNLNIGGDLWAKTVYCIIARGRIPEREELVALRTIFFAHFLTFYKEVIDRTHAEAEKKVVQQATRFRKLRSLALK